MGELAKKIGNEGEGLVLNFFNSIGWTSLHDGKDIDCLHSEDHKSSDSPRKTHGIDLIFSYVCPLIPTVRRNVLISVKNSNEESTGVRNAVIKNDLKDLDFALKCFKKSELRKGFQESGQGATAVEDIGVLVKINKDPDSQKSFLTSVTTRESIPIVGGDPILFIENSRFDFIESVIQFLNRKYKDWKYEFFYSRNSSNISSEKRQPSSMLLPVHNVPHGPLVFRLERDAQAKLLIVSEEPYSDARFRRLVGMALDLSTNWVAVLIAFPDYQEIRNGTGVNQVLQGLRDKSYAAKIQCESYEWRSRMS